MTLPASDDTARPGPAPTRTPNPRWTPGEGIATVAAIALGTGLLEALFLSGKFVLGRTFTWINFDALWMAPLSYLAIYGAVALLMAVLWTWRPRWANAATVVGPFVGLSVYFLLLAGFTSQFHWAARLLLSLGVAVQVTRLVGTRATSPRWGAPAAIALLGLTLTCALVRLYLLPVIHKANFSTVPAPGARNVLLIVMDVVRAKSLSLYGYERPTSPILSRWAERGVVFDSAYATAPWTLPSHASLFTGLPHRDLSVDWTVPLDRRHPVLAERFKAEGYRTAGFVGNWFYTTRQSGLARGFGEYQGLRRTVKQTLLASTPGQMFFTNHPGRYSRERDVDRRSAAQVNARFLLWERQDRTRPFFAFLNYFDAHRPRVAPPGGFPSFVTRRTDQDRYDANIWYIDREIGGLLEELERTGVLDNTIVVITADHGEQFGEHGLHGHGTSLYLPSLHVPLLMLGPGLPHGLRVGHPVSLVDVAATLEELRGTGARTLPGRSLAGCWTGEGCNPSVISAAVTQSPESGRETPSAHGPLVTIIADGWQYIRNSAGEEQLYRLAPGESDIDVAGRPDLAETLARLRQMSEAYALPVRKGH